MGDLRNWSQNIERVPRDLRISGERTLRWFGKTIDQRQTEDDRWTQTRQRAAPDADHVPYAQYTPFKYHSFVYDTHPTHSMHPTSFTTYRPPLPATRDDAHHSADAAPCWPPPSPPVTALKSVPTSPMPKRSPAPNLKPTTSEERTAFIRADAQPRAESPTCSRHPTMPTAAHDLFRHALHFQHAPRPSWTCPRLGATPS